jgi:peptidoglycan/xylan/chitin deacetylase (PgdA/CDA1 family)
MFDIRMSPQTVDESPSLPAGEFALTFDDGPGETPEAGPGPRTMEIARYLSDEQIPATFFMCGKHVEKFPGIARTVIELGHGVGNHTHNHRSSLTLDPLTLQGELRSTYLLLRDCGAPEDIPFRPPFGHWAERCAVSANADDELAAHHTSVVGWDIDGDDWNLWATHRSADACLTRLMQEIALKRAGIILMHDSSADEEPRGADIRAWNRTLEVVQQLVPRLRDLGAQFVALPG